jgi:hypothetical protein
MRIVFKTRVTDKIASMKALIVKSLLTSLCQREGMYPSLAKRGEGRFFNNNPLVIKFIDLISSSSPYQS